MIAKIKDLMAIPPLENEDDARIARILRVILYATLVLIVPYTLSLLLVPDSLSGVIVNLLLFALEIISLMLMRRGAIRLSSIVLTGSFWMYFSFVLFYFGGSQSPAIVGYFLVILIAGLLLGGQAALILSALSVGVGVLLLYAEINGFLPENSVVSTPAATWISLLVAIFIMAVLLQLATGSLQDALDKARLSASALASKNVQLEGIQKVLQEHVEELKQTEAALRYSEEQLRRIVQSAPILLWGINSDGVITVAQGETLNQFGFYPENVIGNSIFDYEHVMPRIGENIRLAMQGKDASSVEVVNGRTLDMRYSPLYEEQGDVVGVIGIAVDITERVQTEEALRQAQKLESLGLLAGGIAHDFNNLLVAMMSQNSLALRLMGEEHRAAKHVEKALRASARAADLTRQMLAFAGKNKYVMTPVSLNMLLVDNLEFLRASIPKNVELRPQMMETLPLIMGDEGQLQQVVMNLIINGADAIGQVPGQVVVTTSVCDVEEGKWGDGWLRANLELQGGRYAVVEVADTGVGMSAETLARIFDPFFTTKEKGRGLGLAAVSGIVRAHQGDLWVRSVLGQGTTFQLLLPILQEGGKVVDVEPPTAVSSTTASTNHQHPSRVLIIDDEEPVLEAVTDILALSGVEALTAVSGQQGIDLYKQHSKDIAVILLDLSMPEMTGEETFYLLRQINPNVPVILSSGYDEKEAKKRIADAGQADFLAKPYDVDILSAKLRGYVAG